MRLLLVIVLSFLSLPSFSQDWQDSLRVARKLYHQKKYSESLEKYKATKRIAPKNVDLSEEMGQTAYKAEDFEQAEKCYDRSVSKATTPKEQAKAYHNSGNTKFKQKKYDEAIESYKQALRRNPNDEQTRYNLSEAMKKRDKQQQNQSGKQNKQQNKPSEKQEKKNPQDEQNEKQKNEQNNPSKNQQNKQNQSDSQQGTGSKLKDKSTEKALDELVKKEMETKKKLGSQKGKGTNSKSGKDW